MLLKELFNNCNIDNAIQIILERKVDDYTFVHEKPLDQDKIARLRTCLKDSFIALKDLPHVDNPEKLLCCVENVNFGKAELDTFCVTKADLVGNINNIERYSYILTDWGELLGTPVSKITLSRYGADRVTAAIFWEMTFFGFTKDAHDKEVKKQEEIMHNPTKSLDWSPMTWEAFREELCKTLETTPEDLDATLKCRQSHKDELRKEAEKNFEECMKYLEEEKSAILNQT